MSQAAQATTRDRPRLARWIFGLLLMAPATGQEVIVDVDEGETAPESEVFQMPYAFSSASWDFAIGYGAAAVTYLLGLLFGAAFV